MQSHGLSGTRHASDQYDFHDVQTSEIYLVSISRACAKVVAETPLFEVTGDVRIGGGLTVSGAASFAATVDVTGDLSQGGKSVGAGHKHTSTTPGTPTSNVN